MTLWQLMTSQLRESSVFFLCLLLCCVCATNLNSSSNWEVIDNLVNGITSTVVENEFIVTFTAYMEHSHQEKELENVLGSDGWELVRRKNPLSNHPSDFGVIRITEDQKNHKSDAFHSRFLDQIHRSRFVKHVVPQRRFVKLLNEFEESPNSVHPSIRGRAHAAFPEEDERNFNLSRFRQLQEENSLSDLFNTHYLWNKGYTGQGVKVAIFDTGLKKDHPHFKNIVERIDWTDENTPDDLLGHGTFVSGIVASNQKCLGFAPDVELYSFRVFTSQKVSYTSWFLDAFNYAILKKINILNLSIGGPDFMDLPFVEKVWEMSANNIIVVSAIGNDGPLYGTLNNPADQLDVIGVGGIDFKDRVSDFSSRGMTTWELPSGYGRVKPDIMAYSQTVKSSTIDGGCKTLSGTSVASPVVAGAIALLASTLPPNIRWKIINPASMKQVLVEGCQLLRDANIFEQGFGKLDLLESFAILQQYSPRVSFLPPALDLTSCPYMWPYCAQPIYYTGMPVIVNVTILNGMDVTGKVIGEPKWIPVIDTVQEAAEFLEVSFRWSETLWPWTGWLGVYIRVNQKAAKWQGTIQGYVEMSVESPPGYGELLPRKTIIRLPLKVNVIPTPPKAKRILWDQYHNLRYPSGYFPRDVLATKYEPFDWNGDHIHTNFKSLFNFLREQGYYIDVLGHPYTCFNATYYGTLLIVDPEDEFFPAEVEKLHQDIENGLSVAIFADWYNVETMKKIKFFDENTKQWWIPVTGGSNVPALNDLLQKYRIAFGDRVYEGPFSIGSHNAYFASGNAIARFPAGGILVPFELKDQTQEVVSKVTEHHKVPIIGFYNTSPRVALSSPSTEKSNGSSISRSGRIVVFGDSSCLDDANRMITRTDKNCFWLLRDILLFTGQNILSTEYSNFAPLPNDYMSKRLISPERMEGNSLYKYSKVINKEAHCDELDFSRFNVLNNGSRTSFTNRPPPILWPIHNRTKEMQTGHFRENMAFRKNEPQFADYVAAYLVPYFLGCLAVLVFVILYIRFKNRIRREQSILFSVRNSV